MSEPESSTVAELRRSEELTRRLIEAMPGGVVHVAADGAIQRANREALRILGLSYDALTHKYTQDFETETIFEDGSPCSVAEYPVTRALMTGEAQAPVTIGVRKPDGGTSWAVFTAVPVVDDGEVSGAVVTFLDITERRRLEQGLRQAQKMEAIGRLAGGIAHDFNNLLTVILGNAQVVRTTFDAEDERRRDLRDIERAAHHAESLTRQLLEFARRRPVQPRAVYLEQLVDETATMLRRVIGERVHLDIEHADAATPVEIDPTRFEQVLINLCINARDAMAGAGRIRIRTGRAGSEPDRVQITVSDDGEGMSPPELERVFEPFFSTKTAAGGTGLGLATVYGAVAQAGGTIEVDSHPGEGSTFSIQLPISSETPRMPSQASSRPQAGGTGRVLVVEDEPLLRDMVERALSGLGYEVVAAADAESALGLADTTSFDVVVTDVVMPGMSGPQMVEVLRGRRPELPVLFMSGYPGDASGLSGPGVRYLEKPFSPAKLARLVQALIDDVE